MKKSSKIAIILSASIMTVSLSIGVTMAASYVAPAESKVFTFSNPSRNFQSLVYYFDDDSGKYTLNTTGDGSTTSYTLEGTPIEIISVIVNGVIKTSSDYSYSGSTFTFNTAPANAAPIAVKYRVQPGTSTHPYLISNSIHLRNLAKLQNIGAIPNSTYVSLCSSFQYTGSAMEPIGTSTHPWVGVFNGNSHVITGLNVSTATYTDVGMFGRIGTTSATGTVHSLVLAGPSVSYTGSSAANVGLVAGYKNTTTQESIVNRIEIYGGTTNFSKVRAHLRSNGTPTFGNGIVGVGGSETSSGTAAGFVNTLSSEPTYTSSYTWTAINTASVTYDLWLDGTTVKPVAD